jgi:DNA polymerase-3 subunit alpha
MGKKDKSVMDQEKSGFMEGARAKGVDAAVAGEVFDLMAFFAGYGFNRSHSAAYGWLTYQTAYLKHHYPHEFMAGLMSCDKDNADNIVKFIAEARAMGLTVERPDVNASLSDFTVHPGGSGKVIRFGLGAVKGVGEGAVELVLEARKDGPFASVYDLFQRVDPQRVNRRVAEALVKAGAFDDLPAQGPVGRARSLAALDAAIERGAAAQRDRRSGQTSLFGLFEAAPDPASPQAASPESYPQVEEWTPKQRLAFEKEALGFYISGHPLDRYRADLSRYASATTADFHEGRRAAGEAAIGGIVAAYRERPTKRGDGKMAFFQLEDQSGQIEVVVFPKTFERVRQILVSDEPLLCSGKVQDEGDGEHHVYRLLLEDAQPLAALRQQKTTRVEIHLDADHVTPEQITGLRSILEGSRGGCLAVVRLRIPLRSETVIPLGQDYGVSPTDDLLLKLERLFGHRVASFS